MKTGKLMKKLLVSVMMIFVLGALSGCGGMTAEEIMEKYIQNNLSIDNCEATMKMELEMGQEGVDETYKVSISSDMQILTSPDYKASMAMTMDMGEMGKYDADIYIVKEGDTYYTYTNSFDTWIKQEITSDIGEEMAKYSNQINMDAYIKNAKNFELKGEETVGDKETYKIEGTISGESIKDILENSELSDYTGADIDSFDFSTIGDLPISIWVSKDDFVPVKIYMDMSSMMNSMMASESLGLTIPVCTMEIEYTGFGTVTDIVLPAEAQDAVSLEDSMDNLGEDSDLDASVE